MTKGLWLTGILRRAQNFEVSINVTTNLESCFKSAQSRFQLVSLLSQFRRGLLGRLNLFPQVLVLLLKVGRPQGDLVLLESLRLPAPPGRLLVLQTLLPVLLVLVLLWHGHHLSLPDDRLWSELVHEEGPLLGVEVISWHGGQGEVLRREVLLHPLPPLLLLLHLGLGHDVNRGQVVAGGGEDGRPGHRHSLHHFLFGARDRRHRKPSFGDGLHV